MDKKLFALFENEIFEEAKRLVPIIYNENEFFYFSTKDYKSYMNKKFKFFSTNIELLLVGLCGLKHDGKDISKEKKEIDSSIDHHIKVLEYDKKEFGANIEETIDNTARDICNNIKKYKDKSLFEVLPVLIKKYMKTHNDSVEHTAFVLYLNNSLKKYGKYLPTTNLCDLEDI